MPEKFFFRNREFEALESVYVPREDSFLLADSVKVSAGESVLDLCCGTGIQGANAVLKGASFACFADKNPKAVENAELNFKSLNAAAGAEFIETDMFSGIQKKFDCIIINPPYVPSSKKNFLELDGGKKGREILDRFLSEFSGFLNPKGRAFFLQSSLNNEKKTGKILRQKGFDFEVLARQKLFFEELLVFCAFKKQGKPELKSFL